MRLPDLHKTLRQQIHIIKESYAQVEIPKLDQLFRTLVEIHERLGMRGRLTDQDFDSLVSNLDEIIGDLHVKIEEKREIKEKLIEILSSLRERLSKRKIRHQVSEVIGLVLSRLEQVGSSIGPRIERRRAVASFTIDQYQRKLWDIAHQLRTWRGMITSKNIAAGMKDWLKRTEKRIPKGQPFRRQVMTVRTQIRNAIGAIAVGNFECASNHLKCAIEHLGFEPKTLKIKPRIDL